MTNKKNTWEYILPITAINNLNTNSGTTIGPWSTTTCYPSTASVTLTGEETETLSPVNAISTTTKTVKIVNNDPKQIRYEEIELSLITTYSQETDIVESEILVSVVEIDKTVGPTETRKVITSISLKDLNSFISHLSKLKEEAEKIEVLLEL